MNDLAANMTADEVDAMSTKRLNQFVLENGVEDLPDYFPSLKPADKKQAVKVVLFGKSAGDMPTFTPVKGETKPKVKAKTTKDVSQHIPKSKSAVKTKAKPKGKVLAKKETSKAVAKTPKQEILPPASGTMIGTVSLPAVELIDIETEAEAADVAKNLLGIGDYATYHLGGIFCKMADEKWFMGHPTFKECCDVEFGVQYRKAAYFMQIFRTLNDKGIKWQDVISVGWTKLKEMLDVMDASNAVEWATKAKGMSTVELIEHIKKTKSKKGQKVLSAPTTFNKVFKLHPDQKEVVDAALADAKIKGDTEVDTVALELICQQFLGEPMGKPMTPEKIIAEYFAKEAGTTDGLKMLMKIIDKEFSDVSMELDIPESYGI